MSAYKTDIADLELTGSSLHRSFASRPIGEGDVYGDRFGVRLWRDGAAVSLSGATVVGYFTRANGDTVALTGTVSGNMAYVSLPQACYAVEGQFTLAIKVVMGNDISTLRIVDGTVVSTTTDTQVDPGSTIPDLATLLARISEMETATAAAIAAYSTYAAAYDASTSYDIGQYAIYDSMLYRCVVDIPAPGEEFTAAHWTTIALCNDLYALRKSLAVMIRPVFYPQSLVGKANCIDKVYIKYSTGEEVSSDETYFCTDFIQVEPNGHYLTNAGRNYAWYDASKAYISGAQGSFAGTEMIAPSNAYYFRFTVNRIKDVGFPDAVNFRMASDVRVPISETRANKLIVGSQFPGNLVNTLSWTDNAYVVANTTGKLSAENSDYFATGYIPVTAGTTYIANHGRNHAWYDSGFAYISGETGTAIQSGITAPTGAAYIRFTVSKTSDGISTPAFLYFARAADFDPKTDIPGVDTASNWYTGKTINWIGDSIVAGTDFDEEVVSAMGMIKPYEYGINGSTISLKGDGTDGRDAVCVRYASMDDDADVIIVSAGTNDFEYAWAPIGTIDSTETTTFYGALKTLCEGLITKYPDKIIAFTTPIKRGQPFSGGAGGTYTADGVTLTPWSKNKYGKTLGDYADIIKEVCGYYSIPVLDMYRESLLNPHIAAQAGYFDEELTHPQAYARKIMARRVCGWLTQLAYTISGL